MFERFRLFNRDLMLIFLIICGLFGAKSSISQVSNFNRGEMEMFDSSYFTCLCCLQNFALLRIKLCAQILLLFMNYSFLD